MEFLDELKIDEQLLKLTGFETSEIEKIYEIKEITQPATINEQGRLDQLKRIRCPHCGEEFTL